MNLKIGGSNVGKIMYGGQEFGGATKLEPGTILYIPDVYVTSFENAHLLNTTKNWSNINGINLATYNDSFTSKYDDTDISGDDFKNLDIEKEYTLNGNTITVSRSIVDGEYRLNVSGLPKLKALIKAI
ncbi:hypothetical protein C5L30_000227 [Companilactobacillus farciminis]|uniref:Uncharacterized protein n=1 Tax=Companilactobacillus farciminis TaxID=1612 RepID=A0A4R5NJ77_9LACO|nr:hypothetical protein [Companilactobacillus farciminis]ATO46118.1 hypothetical protein LF20184_04840 [Companilactobacillus farciminis KCTC 3681 = DSM 20184]KRK62503.1 hypothetical protein FC68_GL002033 [Companilactobacillus farciminis KCTC 3681 = DSM 20184]TDG74511.1 hypothetical protein C5L30_000227 [Companilactobacillus farciminis]